MSKYRPPTPANDHLAAFGETDGLDSLTDAEIEERLKAEHTALSREIRLRTLRIHERIQDRPRSKADKHRP